MMRCDWQYFYYLLLLLYSMKMLWCSLKLSFKHKRKQTVNLICDSCDRRSKHEQKKCVAKSIMSFNAGSSQRGEIGEVVEFRRRLESTTLTTTTASASLAWLTGSASFSTWWTSRSTITATIITATASSSSTTWTASASSNNVTAFFAGAEVDFDVKNLAISTLVGILLL